MSNEAVGLFIKLEAQTRQLQRDFARANSIQAKASKQMEAKAKQSSDKIAKTYEGMGGRIGAAFKSIAMPKLAGIAGTVVGMGVAGAVGAVRSQVSAIAELNNEAKRAGIGVEVFQEWKFVADQNRISIDALTDGFKEMHLRAGEFFLDGTGAGAEAFKKLGYSAEELKAKLKDPSSLMAEILGRLGKLDQASQSFLLEEIFGGAGGEQFSALLGQGEAGLRASIARARDLGLVLDEGAVQKASELDSKFRELEMRMQGLWRSGVVGAAEFFGLIENKRDQLKLKPSDFLGDMSGVMGDEAARQFASGEASAANYKAELQALQAAYGQLAAEADRLSPYLQRAAGDARRMGEAGMSDELNRIAFEMRTAAEQLRQGAISSDQFETKMRELVSESGSLLSALSKIDAAPFGGVIAALSKLGETLRARAAEAAALRSSLPGQSLPDDRQQAIAEAEAGRLPPSPLAPTSSPRPPAAPAMLGEPDLPKDSKGAGGRTQDEFARAIENLTRERAALEAQAVALLAATKAGMEYADALEYAQTRAALLSAAQQANKQITPELSADIDRLARANVAAGNAAQKAADDLKAVEDRGKAGAEALADVFGSVLDGSMSAEDALKQLLLQMAKVQMQKAFLGMFEGSGIGSAVGGLLGFAEGGYTGQGGKFEPAGVVHRGEFVMSKEAVQKLGVGNLDRLHQSALRGYADGGLVGSAGKVARASGDSLRESTRASGPMITISAPVTVNASGGTPEQNGDLAKQVARETEGAMRGVIRDELLRQMRPGGMLG